jgi:hypothetical protein
MVEQVLKKNMILKVNFYPKQIILDMKADVLSQQHWTVTIGNLSVIIPEQSSNLAKPE